jgi:hypothetical protein
MIFESDVLAPENKPAVLEFETFLPLASGTSSSATPCPVHQTSSTPDGQAGMSSRHLRIPNRASPGSANYRTMTAILFIHF